MDLGLSAILDLGQTKIIVTLRFRPIFQPLLQSAQYKVYQKVYLLLASRSGRDYNSFEYCWIIQLFFGVVMLVL
jgi:hypothetical protein